LLRQLLISLVVLVIAGFAYVWFVPGAAETLQRFGIPVPAEAAPATQGQTPGGQSGQAAQGGGQQAQQGQRPGSGQGGGGRRGAREMVVVTAPVTVASINDKLTAIGEGEAAHSVTVMSPSTGTLRELKVSPGEMVTAGTEIGTLDADSEQIAFDRAALAKKDADATLSRTQELAAANAATAVQINAAQLAADNAALEFANAKLALDKRTIVSPIAGSVGLFQVSPGNAVSAQSIVTTIEDTAHIRISFWVPERYASAIAVGAPVEVSAVALPGEKMTGEIVAVDNRIDPASRTLKVQAQIANDSGKLKPGMSFSVSLAFPGEQFPAVDPLSIQWSSDGAYLWKYADGKVERLLVEIIQRNSDGVLVKGDLKQGDQVVTQGLQQLTAGASVRLLDDVLDGSRGPNAGQAGRPPGGGEGGGQGGGGQRPAGGGQGPQQQGQG
jgi:RND family efflux transporter MFP subunit